MTVGLYGIPTDVGILIKLIKDQIVTSGVSGDSYVYPILNDTDEPLEWPTNDDYVTIAPDRFPVDSPLVTGGGTQAYLFNGSVVITLWHRLGTDAQISDLNWITDQTYGAITKWNAILKALEQFSPQDASANNLAAEPMRIISYHFGRRQPRHGWGSIKGVFELVFVQDVS